MSGNEKLQQLAASITEAQAEAILHMAESYLKEIDEAVDDAYCAQLLKEAHEDDDKDPIPLDDFVKELGFDVKDFQGNN